VGVPGSLEGPRPFLGNISCGPELSCSRSGVDSGPFLGNMLPLGRAGASLTRLLPLCPTSGMVRPLCYHPRQGSGRLVVPACVPSVPGPLRMLITSHPQGRSVFPKARSHSFHPQLWYGPALLLPCTLGAGPYRQATRASSASGPPLLARLIKSHLQGRVSVAVARPALFVLTS
jgi:hypothetical protein